jgi:hypothetical protein
VDLGFKFTLGAMMLRAISCPSDVEAVEKIQNLRPIPFLAIYVHPPITPSFERFNQVENAGPFLPPELDSEDSTLAPSLL